MPYDGSGNYNRIHNWQSDRDALIKVRADRHDAEDDAFASGLSNVITKDGQTQPTADIPMNGHKITNIGAPTNPTDAATKGYADSVRSFSSGISLTGAPPEARIGFVAADLSFGTRVEGTPADTPHRFVWNDKADLTGTDIAVMDDSGDFSLPANLAFNTVANQSRSAWKTWGVGFSGLFNFNKTTGHLRYFGTTASSAAGTDISSLMTSALTLDNVGHAALGMALPATVTSSLYTNTSVSLANGGALAMNGHYHADAWRALAAGWLSVLSTDIGTGLVTLGRSTATLAQEQGATVHNLLQFSPSLGTIFGDANLQFGLGGAGVNVQYGGAQVDQYKAVSGTTGYRWLRSSNGLTSGTDVTLMAELTDLGDWSTAASMTAGSTVTGNLGVHFNAAKTYAASANEGNLYLTYAAGYFQFWNVTTGDWSVYASNAARIGVENSTGRLIAFVNAAKPGGGNWAAYSSDARVKTVLGDYGYGLDAIKALHPVRYVFKGNDTASAPTNTVPDPQGGADARSAEEPAAPYQNSVNYQAAVDGTEFVGLLAQEAEAVIPEMVILSEGYIDGQPVTDMRGLDTSELTYALINAVKELAGRVEQLEAAA